MDPSSNLPPVDLTNEKLALPLAPESFKLSSWDPAVFVSDVLEIQAKEKNC